MWNPEQRLLTHAVRVFLLPGANPEVSQRLEGRGGDSRCRARKEEQARCLPGMQTMGQEVWDLMYWKMTLADKSGIRS